LLNKPLVEILEVFNLIIMEKEFIKGKWYRGDSDTGNSGYYMKFNYRKEDRLYFTERSHRGIYNVEHDYWCNGSFTKYALKHGPVSIEEIKDLLPDNHPDLNIYNSYELW